MNKFRIVARNLRRRPLATTLTTLSVALGVALFVTVGALRKAGEEGFKRSAALCDLVVGAKGSPLELTLNTMYHMGQSPGNIPFSLWDELGSRDGVKWTVPLMVGDSWRGWRVIGVTDDLFSQVELSTFGKLKFSSGRPFVYSADDFRHDHAEIGHQHGGDVEAVVGATTGLEIGFKFHPAHDLRANSAAEQHRELTATVVGVLAPTGTPLDRAIYIPAGAYWMVEGHQAEETTTAGGARDPHGVSAVLVRSKPGFYHIKLWRELNDRLDAQAAQPAIEIRRLFDIVGVADQALRLVAALVVAVALAGVLVAVYNTMGSRRHEFAVFRALGASRSTVLFLVVGEAASVAALGGITGLLMAGIGVSIASSELLDRTGVEVSAMPGVSELYLLIMVVSVGALAGLVPALAAYRTEAARHLSSNL